MIRGEEHLPLNPVLRFAVEHGMTLEYLDRNTYRPVTVRRKELISRLLAGRCEWCEKRTPVAEVHHVRKLADLAKPGRPQPAWAQVMAKRRRKTLVVCRTCHDIIHARRPAATPTEQSLESRMR